MELKLSDGDYMPDGFGSFVRTVGTQELLGRALFRLTCRRGAFPFLPELGSRLWLLAREKASGRDMIARQYAAEALDGLELAVLGAAVTDNGDDTASVKLTLACGGETEELEVTVG